MGFAPTIGEVLWIRSVVEDRWFSKLEHFCSFIAIDRACLEARSAISSVAHVPLLSLVRFRAWGTCAEMGFRRAVSASMRCFMLLVYTFEGSLSYRTIPAARTCFGIQHPGSIFPVNLDRLV